MNNTGLPRVLITGGTGFFGASILSMAARHRLPPLQLTILSRNPDRFLTSHREFADLENLDFLTGDIREFVIGRREFDYVIHGATPARSDIPDDEMFSIITEGTAHLLDILRNRPPRKLLFLSSGAVYGRQPPEVQRLPESAPCVPVTAYGKGKLTAEKMCLDSGVPTVIARCFAFSGPYLNRKIHYAIGNFIEDALNGREIIVKGDGTAGRSYLFADDLVDWLFHLLLQAPSGTICNVGSDQEISIKELALKVQSLLNPQSTVKILGVPNVEQPPQRYIPDISTAEKMGLQNHFSLDEIIKASAVIR